MKGELPPPSWEVFDECPTCFTAPKEPCYRLNSTSKKLVVNSLPHPKRKRLKEECSCLGLSHINKCRYWILPL